MTQSTPSSKRAAQMRLRRGMPSMLMDGRQL